MAVGGISRGSTTGMRWGGSRVKGPDCCHLARENPGREKKVGESLGRWLEGTEGGGTPGSDPHGEDGPTMTLVQGDPKSSPCSLCCLKGLGASSGLTIF